MARHKVISDIIRKRYEEEAKLDTDKAVSFMRVKNGNVRTRVPSTVVLRVFRKRFS